MGLSHDQIDDLVLLTENNLIKRNAFVDLQTDLQDHVAVREMWKSHAKTFAGGDNWEFEVQMDHNHSARAVGLFETDASSLTDTMVKGEVPVRHINAHYLYDVLEPAFQKGGHQIVNLVKSRHTTMIVSIFEFMEEVLWSKPTDSTDTKTPYGIAYWITKSATEGFNGGNPSGFTSGKAGISQGTYARWANWTSNYTNITKEDLVRRMRRASVKTRFRSPMSHATPVMGGMRNGIYTNYDVIQILEEVLEAQNQNLGNDVASKDGRTVFKGTPLTYAPYLDNDSSDPVYLIDWKVMSVGVMAGWENQIGKPREVGGHHTVRRVDMDASMNMCCTDLRKQAVIYK